MRMRPSLWLLGIALASSAGATPFSYQGRLLESGVPVNGRYDLRFELFVSEGGGSALAPALTNAQVAVADGVFTSILDFGTNVFFAAGGWLEIGVRPAGAPANFVTLSPRQPLTPAPFS